MKIKIYKGININHTYSAKIVSDHAAIWGYGDTKEKAIAHMFFRAIVNQPEVFNLCSFRTLELGFGDLSSTSCPMINKNWATDLPETLEEWIDFLYVPEPRNKVDTKAFRVWQLHELGKFLKCLHGANKDAIEAIANGDSRPLDVWAKSSAEDELCNEPTPSTEPLQKARGILNAAPVPTEDRMIGEGPPLESWIQNEPESEVSDDVTQLSFVPETELPNDRELKEPVCTDTKCVEVTFRINAPNDDVEARVRKFVTEALQDAGKKIMEDLKS